MNIPFLQSNKLKVTISIDDVDWDTLKEMTNCGDYLDNSTYENALINGILTQVLNQLLATKTTQHQWPQPCGKFRVRLQEPLVLCFMILNHLLINMTLISL